MERLCNLWRPWPPWPPRFRRLCMQLYISYCPVRCQSQSCYLINHQAKKHLFERKQPYHSAVFIRCLLQLKDLLKPCCQLCQQSQDIFIITLIHNSCNNKIPYLYCDKTITQLFLQKKATKCQINAIFNHLQTNAYRR